MRPFIAPIPKLKSQDLSILIKGKPLTDRMIKKYTLAGKYGEEARLREEARTKPRKLSQAKITERELYLSYFAD